MWKKELHAQVSGDFEKRSRRGQRKPKDEDKGGILGKRERAKISKARTAPSKSPSKSAPKSKTSTDHKVNTSTFKS